MSRATRRLRQRGATRPERLAQLADLHNGKWICEGQLEMFPRPRKDTAMGKHSRVDEGQEQGEVCESCEGSGLDADGCCDCPDC